MVDYKIMVSDDENNIPNGLSMLVWGEVYR